MWTYENRKGETVIEQSLDDVLASDNNEIENTYNSIKGEARTQKRGEVKDFNNFFRLLKRK